jgi:hypothetical protein
VKGFIRSVSGTSVAAVVDDGFHVDEVVFVSPDSDPTPRTAFFEAIAWLRGRGIETPFTDPDGPYVSSTGLRQIGASGLIWGAPFTMEWGADDYGLPKVLEPQGDSEELAYEAAWYAMVGIMTEWKARRERAA